MIYASSATTYGNLKKFEVGKEVPNNIYEFSKFAMDNLVKYYIKNHSDIKIVGLRYFNLYGSREYFKNKTSSMVLQFLSGKNAQLFEESDEIKRDFTYIKNVVQANIKACQSPNGIYNIGTGETRSFQDIVDIFKKKLNINRKNIYIPNIYKKQYQYFTKANIKEVKQKLKYEPKYSLENGIKDYLPEIIRIYKEEL